MKTHQTIEVYGEWFCNHEIMSSHADDCGSTVFWDVTPCYKITQCRIMKDDKPFHTLLP